jgi:prepilin-type processing-associated H-X9-DG protein
LYQYLIKQDPQLPGRGDVLFCPTATARRDGGGYNTPTNPWPPPSSGNSRASYCFRPTMNWGNGAFPSRMARLREFSTEALAVDWILNAGTVRARHRSGVNCLHADGSARWVLAAALEPHLSALGSGVTSADNVAGSNVWLSLDKQ